MAVSKKGSLMADASGSNSSSEIKEVISAAGVDGAPPDMVVVRSLRNNCVAQLH